MSSVTRPTRASISLSALAHNHRLLRAAVRVPVLAVVKAQAYGHGALLAAKALAKAGVKSFGVATLDEGLELRKALYSAEIVVLGAVDEGHLAEAARGGIGVTVWGRHYLEEAARRARKAGKPLLAHVKVDTGMTRLGFAPSEIPGILADFQGGRFAPLKLSSAYTHFACADEPRDPESPRQLARFLGLPWPRGLRLHAANSAAALRLPAARLDMVRSGLFLYGGMDASTHPLAAKSRPALRFSTTVLRVARIPKGQGVSYGHTFKARRPTEVATLCAGYADGVPRLLSNRGEVLIHGRRCRILGRVCMDFFMVDVTGIRDVHPGDEAVLIGAQGRERVRASEWARLCSTNAYEILCGISSRVPREPAD